MKPKSDFYKVFRIRIKNHLTILHFLISASDNNNYLSFVFR